MAARRIKPSNTERMLPEFSPDILASMCSRDSKKRKIRWKGEKIKRRVQKFINKMSENGHTFSNRFNAT